MNMLIMYECRPVKAEPRPRKIEVYEVNGKIKPEKTEWYGPADNETLKFYGFDVVEESHNGFDKYVVKRREFRLA